MKNVYRIALVGLMTSAMALIPYSTDAQTRRTTTGTTTSSSTTSSSENRSTAKRSTASSTSSTQRSTTAGTTSSDDRQVRRTTGSNSTGSNSTGNVTTGSNRASSNRSTGKATGSNTGSSTTSSTSSANRTVSGGNANRNTSTGTRTSVVTVQNSGSNAQTATASAPVRATGVSSRAGLTSSNKASTETRQEINYGSRNDAIRLDDNRNINRIPPRDRNYASYDRIPSFYADDYHMYGYRIHTLPPSHKRYTYWGVDYYFHNNVYYRRYGNSYVVCRPPIGIVIDLGRRDIHFSRVHFAYYYDVYRPFDVVDRNYRVILEQNREIARNNAILARQNQALALNSSRALSSYEIARALGLIQSFAGIDKDYFYQDGVFYTVKRNGRFEVIVPPAGALVDELPDDYDIIVLNGVEYYKVDDTVYRLVLIDGIPCLEVLGQMYGSMAHRYNYYYSD
ncbi:MAG: DUF6515 family protein [Bacteroidales bacterium]|nr:DUF6515 family protein [Bacteroidales bacterium]